MRKRKVYCRRFSFSGKGKQKSVPSLFPLHERRQTSAHAFSPLTQSPPKRKSQTTFLSPVTGILPAQQQEEQQESDFRLRIALPGQRRLRALRFRQGGLPGLDRSRQPRKQQSGRQSGSTRPGLLFDQGAAQRKRLTRIQVKNDINLDLFFLGIQL